MQISQSSSFITKPPPGGIRLRLRVPLPHAGKLSKVTVGGDEWTAFNAAEETVDFAASKLTAKLIKTGLPEIVATFGASQAVTLTQSSIDPKDRVVPQPPASVRTADLTPAATIQAVRETSERAPVPGARPG